jgi:16S rRNA U516 pseudouridylate synthase RsuA-like enzyme
MTSRMHHLVASKGEIIMDEDHFNMAVRKFLKEVGVTSQREIERIVREGAIKGTSLRLRMTLTSDDEPALKHVVETTIELR